MKLLISDDNPALLRLLQGTLRDLDYDVVSTHDGSQAFELLIQPDGPQLALIDWMMPGVDGVTLCRKLRSQQDIRPLYLILLTARDNKEDILEGLNAGADDYITKPFDSNELYARIAVGRRLIDTQNEMAAQQKFQGALEMSGTVCHEMNQPLQILFSNSELLLQNLPESDPAFKKLKTIKDNIERLGTLTRKIMSISSYASKSHLNGKRQIIDLENSGTDF